MEIVKSLAHLNLPNHTISTKGVVTNARTKRILKGFMSNGYRMIKFNINKKRVNYALHQLVAFTFLPKPKNKEMTIDHIDRNKMNNNVENLRWATRKEQADNRNKPITIKSKGVLQYTKNGVLIKIWASVKEIVLTLDVPESPIRKCCIGERKYFLDYKWMYQKDKNYELFKDEIWKNIELPNFEKIYASSLGRLKWEFGKPTYGHLQNGYMIFLVRDKDRKSYSLLAHTLIAKAFYGDPKQKSLVVNHKNGIKSDNRPENLEFITQKENVIHAYKTGLIDISKHYRSIICIHPKTDEIVRYYKSFKDACKEHKIPHANIVKVCQGKRETTGGFKWSYADNLSWVDAIAKFKLKENIEPLPIVSKRPRCQPVYRVNPLTGKITGYYENIAEAAKSNNVKQQSISGVCLKKCITTGNNKYFYASDPEIKDKLFESTLKIIFD